MPIVRMPDGTQVSFPDNMPKEQIKGLIESKFPDVKKDIIEPEQGLIERIGGAIEERKQKVLTAPDLPNFLISSARLGVGTPGDIAFEGLKSGYQMLPEAIQEPIEKTGRAIINQPLVQKGLKYGKELAEEYPTTANALGFATELPIGAIASKVGGKVAKKGLEAGRKAINKLSDRFSLEKAAKKTTTAAIDKARANKLYRLSESVDIQFKPDDLVKLNDNLSGILPKSDAAKRAFKKSEASSFINDLQESMATEPLTLNGALAQRSALNDAINSASRSGKNAEVKSLMQVKDALDDTMIKPETGAWQEANHIWGQASAKQDIEDMIAIATEKAQPANSLDNALNTYLRKKGKYLPESEKQAIKDVIGGGAIKELGKNIGSRLTGQVGTAVGASIGGMPGAVAGNLLGTYGSMFARDLAMTNKIRKLDKVFELIDNRPMRGIK